MPVLMLALTNCLVEPPAYKVNTAQGKRALVLLTDAYGGHGGIAKFNRDFLTALTSHPQYGEVVTLPRVISGRIAETLPPKLRFEIASANGRAGYARVLCSTLARNRRFDVVVCGHLHLLPLAWLASRFSDAPLALIIYGIEAWQPTSRLLVNRLAGKINYLISISETTKERFLAWARVSPKGTFILPCSVDMAHFHPRTKNPDLVDRYKLHGKTVLMTLARLPAFDRYKGVDEVLEVMPGLVRSFPEIVYLLLGNGEDLPRLSEKACALGIADRVIFAGYISETEKVNYYNLADVFVMPGRGEGFGIVYLEAMACGVPVVASMLDGSKEAVQDGKLGLLADPRDLHSVENGIREALVRGRKVPPGLEYFSYGRFQERVREILDKIAPQGRVA